MQQAAARHLDVPPGIRVDGRPLATEHDFYSTHESLRLRFGKFDRIRLYDDPAQATREGDGVNGLAADDLPFNPTFHPGSPAANWNPGGYHTLEHRWAL